MQLKWFRMYCDFLDDPKLLGLSYEDQRHFIGVLACKALGLLDNGATPVMLDRIVAQRLWIDYAIVCDAKKRLANAGLIDPNTWQPLAWEKRQFRSDHDLTAAERQRKYREAHRNALRNALDNGTVTPTEESRRETETETEKTSISKPQGGLPACPAEEIISLYHEILPANPTVAVLTKTRRGYIQQRWREFFEAGDFQTREQGLGIFADYFQHVSRSKFLTGKTKPTGDRKPFIADLEWLVKPANFAKVIEGKYQ